MKRCAAYLPVMIPYVAVGLGVYVFRNVWLIAAVYYLGVLAFAFRSNGMRLFGGIFEGFSWIGLVLAVAGGIVVYAAIVFVWSFAAKPGIDIVAVLGKYCLGGTALPWFVIGALLVNPLMEELLWRGMLDTRPSGPGWLDAAFGGYHVPVLFLVLKWPYIVIGFVGLCGVSWALRYAKHRFGGLAIPLFGHFVADLAVVLAVYHSI